MYTINEAIKWSAWMAIIRRTHDPVKLKFFVCCCYHYSFAFLRTFSYSSEDLMNQASIRTHDSNSDEYFTYIHFQFYFRSYQLHSWPTLSNILLSVQFGSDFHLTFSFNCSREFYYSRFTYKSFLQQATLPHWNLCLSGRSNISFFFYPLLFFFSFELGFVVLDHNEIVFELWNIIYISLRHMLMPAMTAYRDPTEAPLRKLSVDLIKTYKHINEVKSFFSPLIQPHTYLILYKYHSISYIYAYFFSLSLSPDFSFVLHDDDDDDDVQMHVFALRKKKTRADTKQNWF